MERISIDLTVPGVDPEVLALLVGRGLEPGEPTSAVEIHWRPRRTLCQWLRRRPREYRSVVIPAARVEGG